jgi:hypothetical protein
MQIQARYAAGIADGSITLTFRRWKRLQVVAGHTYRTAAGRVVVDAVDDVDPGSITEAEARRAGYMSVAALRADLRGDPAAPVYRIRLRPAPDPDPRAELAAADVFDADAVAELDRRLGRLDRHSPTGPWTRATLELIERCPATVSTELAAALGRERPAFKLDVRKLKALGLTISLERGYRLSPRGQAYLREIHRRGGR